MLFLFLFAVLLYVFFTPPKTTVKNTEPTIIKQSVCQAGNNRTCNVGACKGTETCNNGQWGNCLVATICTPGKTYPCMFKGCSCGVKVCNECGTGYSNCTNLTKQVCEK